MGRKFTMFIVYCIVEKQALNVGIIIYAQIFLLHKNIAEKFCAKYEFSHFVVISQ